MPTRILIATGVVLLFAFSALAQKPKSKKTKTTTSKTQTLADKVKKYTHFGGLFDLYQDPKTGKVMMKIREDQLDRDYIYFSYIDDGVVDAGHFRGSYRDARIFRIRKYFNRIEFLLQNTSYWFDPENALSKAAEANINQPVIVSVSISKEDKAEGAYLIDAKSVFLTENFQQVKRTPPSGNAAKSSFKIGKLSKEKTKYLNIRNYPENSDVLVEYVYEQAYPSRRGSEEVTDSRFVSVKLRHSLIEVPESNFEPRFEDPRVGYFTHKITDMTSISATPYRDVIHRWNLEKKDPGAAISDPVEPITWWIENTTPRDLRPIIRDGVMAWNQAFEKAGFSNAVVVKEQPDDADWDAGDIRYNVLRWTSSPRPPFGGYGPSFVNPRTGQILGADIMLEFVYLTKRLNTEKLFDLAGLQTWAEEEEEHAHDLHRCSLAEDLHYSTMFGMEVLAADKFPEVERDEFVKQSLYRLVLHEVGHTLGLNHNFRASTLHATADIHNKALTGEKGLTGSVMDYPAINIAVDREKQGQYYDVKPGLYDTWAIEFGYSVSIDDEAEEAKRLAAILDRSNEPGLGFGNDADDMRAPGKGVDPRIMINDLTSDPVNYSIERIKLVNATMPKLKAKYAVDGETYHELRNAYLILTREYATALNVVSRQVGGLYLDRSVVGQEGATQPFTPVPVETQRQAMQVLSDYAFSPEAFASGSDLYAYLQAQRRGFDFFGRSHDPRIHARILNIQKGLLDQLMNYKVLRRITDSELYGNEYQLTELFQDLSKAIFAQNTGRISSQQQNLQIEYVKRLGAILAPKSKYHTQAQSLALYQLKKLDEKVSDRPRSAEMTAAAHEQHLQHLISSILDTKG